MDNPRKTFAERFKIFRKYKGYNQSQLARILNISRATVSGYETLDRFPSIEMLVKISRFFNISIDYLVGVDNGIPIEYADICKLTSKEAKSARNALIKLDQLLKSSLLDKDLT